MANALADNQPNQQMPSMGNGLAQGAGDMIRLRKAWELAYTNGETDQQFREWLAAQGVKNPVMPR